jgi:2-hydroxychromene-2-carboxylate isomerase
VSRLARRTVPRAVVLAARADVRGQLASALRRRGTVELYFAFDDPCSAIALLDLGERLGPLRADLDLRPVVKRGISSDPAVEDKRRYAIADARRLASRAGWELVRGEPLAPEDAAPLAAWVAGGAPGPALERFCAEAVRSLWFAGNGPVPLSALERRWRELGLGEPPREEGPVRANERRMRRRGPYDTPAAWVHGQWFFAHERGAQVAARLGALGFGDEAAA